MTVGSELARSLTASFDDDALAAAGFALAVAVGSRPGGELDETCVRGVPAGTLSRAALEFERRGWLIPSGYGWSVPLVGMPPTVPTFLQGVAATRTALAQTETSHAVITMPRPPSALGAALPATGVAYAALLTTADGMTKVAAAARERLTIMTPFLNLEGLRFVAGLFALSAARNRKLVLRRNAGTLQALADGSGCLAGLGVDLRNYCLPSQGGYETFHAKVVLADEHLVCIGSANMLGYSRSSVELGVVLEGRAARVIASVVRAVEEIAPAMACA